MNQSEKINTNYQCGDIVVSSLYSKTFEIQKVNKEFGTVEWYINGRRDTIGFAYIRKANLIEKLIYYIENFKYAL